MNMNWFADNIEDDVTGNLQFLLVNEKCKNPCSPARESNGVNSLSTEDALTHWLLRNTAVMLTHCGLGDFRWVLFKLISVIDGGWAICREIALRWMALDLTNDKSTLVQVMAWCRQATSHYLSQCWPRSMSPNVVTRPLWVKWVIFKLISRIDV